jgi:hypothetical protein
VITVKDVLDDGRAPAQGPGAEVRRALIAAQHAIIGLENAEDIDQALATTRATREAGS